MRLPRRDSTRRRDRAEKSQTPCKKNGLLREKPVHGRKILEYPRERATSDTPSKSWEPIPFLLYAGSTAMFASSAPFSQGPRAAKPSKISLPHAPRYTIGASPAKSRRMRARGQGTTDERSSTKQTSGASLREQYRISARKIGIPSLRQKFLRIV